MIIHAENYFSASLFMKCDDDTFVNTMQLGIHFIYGRYLQKCFSVFCSQNPDLNASLKISDIQKKIRPRFGMTYSINTYLRLEISPKTTLNK